ncbi:MAG: sulfatase-like hydrolase/transferase [Planctomycetota bacterium]
MRSLGFGLDFRRAAPALGALTILGFGACGGGEGSSASASARTNVLVVSIDTLRRDAVGFHGCAPSPSPNLDAFAAEGVVFDDAYTVSPVTLPAHTSLLTGLYPVSHGVRDNGANRVPVSAEPLAELLTARGYRCRAAVAAFVLNEGFGLDQGFEVYSAPRRGGGKIELAVADLRADLMVNRAIEDLDELAQDEAPFLYWLHLYDPHAPYSAPGSTAEDMRTQYEDEVRFADAELGRLFAHLRERGLWDDLTVVVTSDHGEGLEDGHEKSHGYFIFDQTMRIPLVLKSPGLAPATVGGAVSLIDVVPTLLELLDVAAPSGGFDGMSLVPAIASGTAGPGRVLGLESYLPYVSHGWAPFEGAVRDKYKVIRSHQRELYDRAADPGEERDLYRDRDALSEGMLAEVRRLFETPERRLEREAIQLDAKDLEQLASLGYSGEERSSGDEGTIDFDALPDTYERFPIAERLWALGEDVEAGRVDVAIKGLRDILKVDPDDPYAQTRLGELLMLDEQSAARNVGEAERLLMQALAQRPEDAAIHWSLARVAKVRADKHRRDMDRAGRAGDDESGRVASELWREQMERFLRELRIVLELEPSHTKALGILSVALIEESELSVRTGQTRKARKTFQESIDNLGRLMDTLDPADPARASYGNLRSRAQARLDSLPPGR